eukprot:1151681-Pelagomonas_calceolata.AAC.2
MGDKRAETQIFLFLVHVLNASNNNLEILPADVGWLPLKELRVSGNPNLRIPQTVLKHGFKWVERTENLETMSQSMRQLRDKDACVGGHSWSGNVKAVQILK